MMHVAFNKPTMCYLIEASSPGQGFVFHFRIDQALPRGDVRESKDRVHNQVQAHLDYIHRRTGLNYSMVYWADPVRFTAYIKENKIELS